MAQNDPYGLLASGLPAEYASDANSLQRKRAIQDAIMRQSLEPLPAARDAGRFRVAPSPWEGLAKVAQAYMATKGSNRLDQREQELGQRYQSRVQSELEGFKKTAEGSEPRIINAPTMEGMTGSLDEQDIPTRPEATQDVKGDPRKAVLDAMMNPYLRNNPNMGAMAKMVTPDWEVVEQFDAMGNKQKVLMDKNNPSNTKPFGEAQKMPPMFKTVGVLVKGKENIPHEQEMVSLNGGRSWAPVEGGTPNPKFNPNASTRVVQEAPPVAVVTKDGKGVEFVSRAEAIRDKRVPANLDPDAQRRLSGAKVTGREEAKAIQASEADQRQMMDALRSAGYDPNNPGKEDKIEQLIKSSTSGAIERGAASVVGWFPEAVGGGSTSGMKSLRSVESLASGIVLDLMNRKLGAGISNADREFIVGQLGDVGNGMKPYEERLAAWRQAKNRMIDVGLHPTPVKRTDGPGIPSQSEIDAELARREREGRK